MLSCERIRSVQLGKQERSGTNRPATTQPQLPPPHTIMSTSSGTVMMGNYLLPSLKIQCKNYPLVVFVVEFKLESRAGFQKHQCWWNQPSSLNPFLPTTTLSNNPARSPSQCLSWLNNPSPSPDLPCTALTSFMFNWTPASQEAASLRILHVESPDPSNLL